MLENAFNLKELYALRQDFIVIGLTGRTGSGCSWFANLMTTEKFKDCNFPAPNQSIGAKNDDRKYRIAYDFLKENWKPFFVIKYSEILSLIVYKEQMACIDILLNRTKEVFQGEFPNNVDFSKELAELEKLRNETDFIEVFDEEGQNDYEYDFFLSEKFRHFDEGFQKALSSNSKLGRILILHTLCNNLRRAGCYYCEDTPALNSIYTISDRIKSIIKGHRHRNRGKSCRVIIDSLRNPLEIMYFKERYSAYYTMAINPQEDIKDEQLETKYESEVESIRKIDNFEYGHKYNKTDFYKQNVQKCIEKSDLHLSFRNDPISAYPFDFYQQVVIFYSLMLQPGIVTPSPQERCMQIAYTAKYNSGCISRQVGAVISDESYSIKAIGWNNVPQGQVPCLLRSSDELLEHSKTDDSEGTYSPYEKDSADKFYPEFKKQFTNLNRENLQGHNCSFCFKDVQNSITEGKNQVHTRSLHAEENAMLQISKYGGIALKGGILFTTASPCELCAKKAYQLGIIRIYYIDPYPGISKTQILNSGSSKVETLLFTGAIGRAYHKLYEPFMPYKDELYIRTGMEIVNKVSQLESENARLKEENAQLKRSL
jgi:deoxycytidylate deaminase